MTDVAVSSRPTAERALAGRWARVDRWSKVAIVFVVVVAAMALAAPVLPLQDPTDTDLANRFAGWSGDHLLGTDGNGRDLLSRLVWGARSSLVGPLVVTLVATALGTALALTAAWRGGRVDAVVTRCFDIVFSFPGILLALLAVAVIGKGQLSAIITLSVAYTPYVGRIVRSAALREVPQPYVSALWAQGQSSWRIATRHLVPNLRSIVLAQMTLTFGYSLIDLAALSFLGVGAPQDQPDWGVMVAGGQGAILTGNPQESLFGALMLFLTVLAFSTLGERMGGGRRRVTRR